MSARAAGTDASGAEALTAEFQGWRFWETDVGRCMATRTAPDSKFADRYTIGSVPLTIDAADWREMRGQVVQYPLKETQEAAPFLRCADVPVKQVAPAR